MDYFPSGKATGIENLIVLVVELAVSPPIPTRAMLIFNPALASFFPYTATLSSKSIFITILPYLNS